MSMITSKIREYMLQGRLFLSLFIFLSIAGPLLAGQSSGGHEGNIITSVGIAILAATVTGYLSNVLRQPLLLAYIAAGVLIGPRLGLGLIGDIEHIETISHFGLIFLLFLIGLEIDMKKLRSSGKSLLAGGLTQFPLTVLAGLPFFMLMGYSMGGGRYDAFYLAVCCALSSTAIVVKLLYGKFELDTLAGRITLGILVFQDVWAIIFLGIQPNLSNPDLLQIMLSFAKGLLLIVLSMGVSRYVLPKMFRSIAKVPELVLISSLGWCFLVCGAAAMMNLSLEMGALIAGVAISTFPYNLDVIAKVVNIRDFFVTLFFVSLGMRIPNPLDDVSLLIMALAASGFLVASRFAVIFPVLYSLKNGLRVSLLTPVNLSQISEFSLVIVSLGLAAGHISQATMSVVIFIFVITSALSTYMIKYNDAIQRFIAGFLKRLGMKEATGLEKTGESDPEKDIALLGFYRTASSLLNEIMESGLVDRGLPLKDRLVVVDFNPEIHDSLQSLGVKVVYGDISHPDTLHHAGIHDVKIVISTIPDTILVGTDNLTIIRHMRELCPHARVVVTAESVERALKMYAEGADYVFLPRIIAARSIMEAVKVILEGGEGDIKAMKKDEVEKLSLRNEVMR